MAATMVMEAAVGGDGGDRIQATTKATEKAVVGAATTRTRAVREGARDGGAAAETKGLSVAQIAAVVAAVVGVAVGVAPTGSRPTTGRKESCRRALACTRRTTSHHQRGQVAVQGLAARVGARAATPTTAGKAAGKGIPLPA